jgi:hypothetical protein
VSGRVSRVTWPIQPAAGARRGLLAWRRLPLSAEVATIGAGYMAYSLVRVAIRAGRPAAFAHAAQLWRAERCLHLDVEPYLNHLAAAHTAIAELAGYYYGLLHFLVTPLALALLYLRRPAAFPRLRSGLVLSTAAANVVFWAWPVAPPRFSVPGMTDVLVTRDILGAASPHGPTGLVNLYAAMPSLHVAWAVWCAVAAVIATRGRWRHLAWFYPAATALVVLASANHFVLDVAAGVAATSLGMIAASWPARDGSHRTRQPATTARRTPVPGRSPARVWLYACWAGGWAPAFCLQPQGGRAVETADETWTLARLVVSTRLPVIVAGEGRCA